jgi:hypothetical protein
VAEQGILPRRKVVSDGYRRADLRADRNTLPKVQDATGLLPEPERVCHSGLFIDKMGEVLWCDECKVYFNAERCE